MPTFETQTALHRVTFSMANTQCSICAVAILQKGYKSYIFHLKALKNSLGQHILRCRNGMCSTRVEVLDTVNLVFLTRPSLKGPRSSNRFVCLCLCFQPLVSRCRPKSLGGNLRLWIKSWGCQVLFFSSRSIALNLLFFSFPCDIYPNLAYICTIVHKCRIVHATFALLLYSTS